MFLEFTEKEIKKIEEKKKGFPTVLSIFDFRKKMYIITENTPICPRQLDEDDDLWEATNLKAEENEEVCNLAWILAEKVREEDPADEAIEYIEMGECPSSGDCYTAREFVESEASCDLSLICLDMREGVRRRIPAGNYVDLLKNPYNRLEGKNTRVFYERKGYEGISLKLQREVVKKYFQEIRRKEPDIIKYIKALNDFLED